MQKVVCLFTAMAHNAHQPVLKLVTSTINVINFFPENAIKVSHKLPHSGLVIDRPAIALLQVH